MQVRGARGSNEVETYVPYWLNPEAGINVVLKTASDPTALAAPLQQAVKAHRSGGRRGQHHHHGQDRRAIDRRSRFYATLVALFAPLALILAAVGIYGVMSYARVAADAGDRRAARARGRASPDLHAGDWRERLAGAVGLGLGLVGAIVVGRSLRTLLYGVHSADALTLAGTARCC